MADETLLTAARRAVRCFNIDEAQGGLMSTDTIRAILTLDNQVQLAAHEKARIDGWQPMETLPQPESLGDIAHPIRFLLKYVVRGEFRVAEACRKGRGFAVHGGVLSAEQAVGWQPMPSAE